MERKHFKLELKTDAESRTVEGWASTFGNTDSYGDIIAPGAFMETVAEKAPKMLWQHNSDQLIGVWTEAKETAQGLYVKGTLAETQLGNEAYTLGKMGALDAMSIGFSTKESSYDHDTGVRTILKVDLWEVSLVTFPANPLARITDVRNKPADERALEEYLREAGYSRSEAKAIIAKGYKAIAGQREAEGQELKELATLFKNFTNQITI